EHAVDRLLEELAILDGLHVVALDAAVDLAEKPQVVHGQRERRRLAIRDRGEMQAGSDAERRAESHQADLLKILSHSYPSLRFPCRRAHCKLRSHPLQRIKWFSVAT